MIYVSENQLSQVEYLLAQSMNGHHVLFDLDLIRNAVGDSPKELSQVEIKTIEKQIETLISKPTLMHKRLYLETLAPETMRRLIRVYFNIVENNIFEKAEELH